MTMWGYICRCVARRRDAAGERWFQSRMHGTPRAQYRARRRLAVWDWVLDTLTRNGTR